MPDWFCHARLGTSAMPGPTGHLVEIQRHCHKSFRRVTFGKLNPSHFVGTLPFTRPRAAMVFRMSPSGSITTQPIFLLKSTAAKASYPSSLFVDTDASSLSSRLRTACFARYGRLFGQPIVHWHPDNLTRQIISSFRQSPAAPAAIRPGRLSFRGSGQAGGQDLLR